MMRPPSHVCMMNLSPRGLLPLGAAHALVERDGEVRIPHFTLLPALGMCGKDGVLVQSTCMRPSPLPLCAPHKPFQDSQRYCHSREGIGHQPAGQVEGETWEGTWRGKARKTGTQEMYLSIKRNQSRTMRAMWNGVFIITVGRYGSRSTGRRLRGESDRQTRNGNLISADLVGSTWGLQHEPWGT
jgi:hypothetical protein